MRYAGIIKNDISAAPGVCLTFFTQGCHFHCTGCHNQDLWDFNGGKEFTTAVIDDIIKSINANGVMRNLCIMGGEPLCTENLFTVETLIYEVKKVYPDIKIFIWTGYDYDDLINDTSLEYILSNTYCLVDGKFIIEKRDITLSMRGSSNQRIIYLNTEEGDEFAD